MLKESLSVFSVFGLICFFFTGCDTDKKSDICIDSNILELVSRSDKPFPVVSTNSAFMMLRPEDVVVAVNGYPLRKKLFDELTVIKVKELSARKDANPGLTASRIAAFKSQYVKTFVSQRLLIDQAWRLNVMSTNDLSDKVQKTLEQAAASKNRTIDQFIKSYPADPKYLLYDIAANVLIQELIKKHIPPLHETNHDLITNVQAQVALENAATAKTNETFKAMLSDVRNKILSGEMTFDEAAKRFSQDKSTIPQQPAYWDEFERGAMDDKRVQAVAFSLKKGEISEPVEDDDGLHLIKVVDITPPQRDKNGKVIRNETRKLHHIYREKMPLLLVENPESLAASLRYQMQMQAIDSYIGALITNKVNRIEYPNGKISFK